MNHIASNSVTLSGVIVSEATFSHEVYSEKFYCFLLEVKRLSENSDILPITVSERLLTEPLAVGSAVTVTG